MSVNDILLGPLAGSAPLGFLAALGALDVVDRGGPERGATLRWTDELVPRAVLCGPGALDDVIDAIVADAGFWRTSALLAVPATDIKPSPAELHAWAATIAARGRAESDLFTGLLAEGAQAGNSASKPTHLHFTAGQQQFLTMVRSLADHLDRAMVEEALRGPWRYASTLPTLGWDARGERIYALRGTDPSKEKRTGVPGADWLAFLGLSFLPTFARERRLLTTACEADWKTGSFTWPLWSGPLPAPVVRSLLAYRGLVDEPVSQQRARGVFRILTAPIARSEQGGYGSFRPAQPALPGRRHPTRSGGRTA